MVPVLGDKNVFKHEQDIQTKVQERLGFLIWSGFYASTKTESGHKNNFEQRRDFSSSFETHGVLFYRFRRHIRLCSRCQCCCWQSVLKTTDMKGLKRIGIFHFDKQEHGAVVYYSCISGEIHLLTIQFLRKAVLRIRILISSSENSLKTLDSYYFALYFMTFNLLKMM